MCYYFNWNFKRFFFSIYRHTGTTVDSNTWSSIRVRKFRQKRVDKSKVYNAISIIRSCVCPSYGNRA